MCMSFVSKGRRGYDGCVAFLRNKSETPDLDHVSCTHLLCPLKNQNLVGSPRLKIKPAVYTFTARPSKQQRNTYATSLHIKSLIFGTHRASRPVRNKQNGWGCVMSHKFVAACRRHPPPPLLLLYSSPFIATPLLRLLLLRPAPPSCSSSSRCCLVLSLPLPTARLACLPVLP